MASLALTETATIDLTQAEDETLSISETQSVCSVPHERQKRSKAAWMCFFDEGPSVGGIQEATCRLCLRIYKGVSLSLCRVALGPC